MRIATAVFTVVAAQSYTPSRRSLLAAAQEPEQCILGGFVLEFDGPCTEAKVLAEYERQVYDMQDGVCADGGAAADLEAKLTAAGMTIDMLCQAAMDAAPITEFHRAASRGTDMAFEQHFFNGRTDWQEEVETIYDSEDESATSILSRDAQQIKGFYGGVGQYGRATWPGSLTNFDETESCASNTAMCCWPKDRQANDNNGNCAKPYDTNCVDKDPADNTNLCHVDYSKGNASNEFESTAASSVFPLDNNHGEGSIHCHGFAWANDEYDSISRYRANNLFYVSMYDHMHQRGYVENIPGAPMCGCVEQMPTVSRSDCTQVDLEEVYKITFDGSAFKATLENSYIDFNACQGINNRNNDLWAYTASLYREGRMSNEQFGTVGKIITDNGCDRSTDYHLKQKSGLDRGYKYDESKWTNAIGRDGMRIRPALGLEGFKTAFFVDSDTAPSDPTSQAFNSTPILLRVCATCIPSHQKIYYRRLTRLENPSFDLLRNLAYDRTNGAGDNTWGEDFTIHSTYEDATSGDNPWKCPHVSDNHPNGIYNYGARFPGECSPSGARVTGQASQFGNGNSRKHVGFYINKAEDSGIGHFDSWEPRRGGMQSPTSVDIGNVNSEGFVLERDGVYHISGSGSDIWSRADEFHYFSEAMSGDATADVFMAGFSSIRNTWQKAGIMIRQDNEPDSPYVFAFLSGRAGLHLQGRTSRGGMARGIASTGTNGQKEAWIRLSKKGNLFEMYTSGDDGETWTFVGSMEALFADDSFRVGLAVLGNHHLIEVVFENYEVSQYYAPTAAPTVSLAPTSMVPGKDIGEPQRLGEYIYEPNDQGIAKIIASGAGTWGTHDSFYFHKQEEAFNTDLTAQLVVTGLWVNPSSSRWAKGGIMIRDSLASDASFVFLSFTKSEGVAFQSRELSGVGEAVRHHGNHYIDSNSADNKPELKLVREGSDFSGYYKNELDAEFTLLGTTTIDLEADFLYVGIAVTASSTQEGAQATLDYKGYSLTMG